MNKPHKHAEVIKAWADGKLVQVRHDGVDWIDCNKEGIYFSESSEFRIKPEPKYPETRMTVKELDDIYESNHGINWPERFTNIANAAIRRAIQDGDVVLPEK